MPAPSTVHVASRRQSDALANLQALREQRRDVERRHLEAVAEARSCGLHEEAIAAALDVHRNTLLSRYGPRAAAGRGRVVRLPAPRSAGGAGDA